MTTTVLILVFWFRSLLQDFLNMRCGRRFLRRRRRHSVILCNCAKEACGTSPDSTRQTRRRSNIFLTQTTSRIRNSRYVELLPTRPCPYCPRAKPRPGFRKRKLSSLACLNKWLFLIFRPSMHPIVFGSLRVSIRTDAHRGAVRLQPPRVSVGTQSRRA